MRAKTPHEMLMPNRNSFRADPFGYSISASSRWALAQHVVGGLDTDPTKPPTTLDLKCPVLWLLQAQALTEAATRVLKTEPEWENVPVCLKGVCDSQYCAAGLMLVGYSLEVCLKAMLVLTKGAEAYALAEKAHKTHDLVKLADLIPGLGEKDKAILEELTLFVLWAGRYPDPGSGREKEIERVFTLTEKHQIAARDLFGLAARVMGHIKTMTG